MRHFLLILFSLLIFTNCQSKKTHQCPFNFNNHNPNDQCGFVEVPRNRANNSKETTQLSYLLIKSQSKNRKADPVVFIQGGPGGDVLKLADIYSQLSIDSDRDFILYDQRGIGFSEELCPNINQKLIEILAKDLNVESEIKELHEALKSCKKFIKNDSRQFSTTTNVEDLEALREHLGYKQLNLFGGSYGTRLGVKYMELYPNKVRSAILSSLFPPEIRMYDHLFSNFENALNKVFTACENDFSCNSNYPNLKSDFTSIYNKIKTEPIVLKIGNSNFTLNQQDVLLFLHQMLYSDKTISKIPEFIKALKLNDKKNISRTINTFVPRITTINLAVYYAVMTADEGNFDNKSMLKNDSKNLLFSSDGLSLFSADPEIIESWPTQKTTANNMGIITSEIPTLLISGDFDPVTPVSNGNQVQKSLKNSQHLVFKNNGHVPINDCFFNLAKTFLNNPMEKLDGNCSKTSTLFNWD